MTTPPSKTPSAIDAGNHPTLILRPSFSEVNTMPRGGNDDNRADQMNPNNDAYWQSRGYDERPDDWESHAEDDDDGNDDNRANQLNPNNDAYWSSRGTEKPD